MFEAIRTKFGPIVIGGVVGMVSIAFVAGDLLRPKATRGLHEGAVAGKVNGEAITLSEFNRALNQRLEMFKNFGGGKFSDAQLRQFGIHKGVFDNLVSVKLMLQEAKKYGFVPSDEEIREKVSQYPAFQKDGKFDMLTYRQLLEANHLTPGSYESMMRDELSVRRFQEYFRSRSVVSDEEVKREFIKSHDRRNVKYIVLNHESAKKGMTVAKAEIDKILADKTKEASLKSRFEIKKSTEFKGKTFDQVKDSIAREVYLSEKTAELDKANEELGRKIEAVLTADKSSDAKVNALLKAYGVEVKSTGMMPRDQLMIPGAGKVSDLVDSAFKGDLSKAKLFKSPAAIVIGVVTEKETANLSALGEARDEMIEKLQRQKEGELFQNWIEKVKAKSTIQQNDDVVLGTDQG